MSSLTVQCVTNVVGNFGQHAGVDHRGGMVAGVLPPAVVGAQCQHLQFVAVSVRLDRVEEFHHKGSLRFGGVDQGGRKLATLLRISGGQTVTIVDFAAASHSWPAGTRPHCHDVGHFDRYPLEDNCERQSRRLLDLLIRIHI